MHSPGADAIVGAAPIQAKAEADWARSASASLPGRWMPIPTAGSVAWAATHADLTVRAGWREMTIPAHITFVLARRGDRWLIVQAHDSFAGSPPGG